MKRSSFFAAVGLNLSHHHRVLRIKRDDNRRVAAIGTWLVALLYTRREELDGFVPADEIEHLATADIVRDLVEVGLFSAEEKDGVHGFRVLKYEVWNETKRDVERRLKGDRMRKKSKPAPARRQPDSSAYPPTSGSIPDGIPKLPVGIPPTETETETETQIPRKAPQQTDPIPVAETKPEPVPATGRLPDWHANVEREHWIAAYERAVVAARGGPEPWSFPRKALNALRSVVEAYCTGEARKNVPEWIERDVGAFVRAVGTLDTPVSIWSAYGPDGLQKWHNEGRPGAPGKASTNPYDGPAVRAERARREADQEQTRRNAVPAPIGALFAALGDSPPADDRPSETRAKALPAGRPELAREMTDEEREQKRRDDQRRLQEFDEQERKRAAS